MNRSVFSKSLLLRLISLKMYFLQKTKQSNDTALKVFSWALCCVSFFAFSKCCSILRAILAHLGIFVVCGVDEDGDEYDDHHYANNNAYY